MIDVAVLIPCYNEAKTIDKVVKDYLKVIPNNSKVYVYDNNSTDDTAKIAEAAGATVRKEYQQGKGNVIRRMFREIDAKCYIMVDGDDTYPAEYATEMIEKVLEKNVDMVIGDRLTSTYFTENKRPFHNFGNSLVRKSINVLFKSNIKDIMTGYRAFSYQFVKSFPVLSQGFEIETEMSIHAVDKNMLLDNVVIDYRDRPEGSESKLNTYSDGFKVIKTIVNLYKNYKPLAFFGSLSAILFALSFIFFVPVLVEYFNTGLVPNFPTLIVCGFVAIAAIQSLFSGLILETIKQKNRQDFEMELVAIHQRFLASGGGRMRKLIEQIFRFGIVGIICFFIDYFLMIGLVELLNFNVLLASGISFSVSVIINYLLSMHYVFQSKDSINKLYELVIFILLSIGGLCINELLMWVMVDCFYIYYMFSKIIVTGIVMVYNFITRKVFLEAK